jgi:uncharacterized RDD family membrane protein YckC
MALTEAVLPTEQEPMPAGFWRRAVALILDVGLVLWIGFFTTLLMAYVQAPGAVIYAAKPAVWIVYFTWMIGRWGQTIGKRAAGVHVVTSGLERVGYRRALWRHIASWLSTLLAGVGHLMAAFTPGKKTLHDYLAQTRAIRVVPVGTSPRILVLLIGLAGYVSPFLLAALMVNSPPGSRFDNYRTTVREFSRRMGAIQIRDIHEAEFIRRELSPFLELAPAEIDIVPGSDDSQVILYNIKDPKRREDLLMKIEFFRSRTNPPIKPIKVTFKDR